jgi:hypothetical protein
MAHSTANLVLHGMDDLPENPTNVDFEQYFNELEEELQQFGYVSALERYSPRLRRC